MRKIVKILFFIFIFLLIIAGAVYIDFFISKKKNTYPKIAIKKEIDSSLVVYNAPFYRVWYCKENNLYTIGDYNDSDAICRKEYTYENGYYVNGSNLIIAKRDLEMIKDYYDSEVIELFNSESSIEEAVYVSSLYEKQNYKPVLDEENNEVKVGKTSLIRIPTFVEDENGNFKWKLDDKTYCLNIKDDKKYYSLYENEECSKDYTSLDLDTKWCTLYENSKLFYKKEINELCKGDKK